MDSAVSAGAKGPDRPARLRVRLLGELELRRGDAAPLALPPSRRTRALLGYLVATRAPQLRSALCDMLWDGPDDPRAALRWSLTKLRALVDDAAAQRLQADRERVAFDARDCDVDSSVVDAALDGEGLACLPLETLEELARTLQGEFLDGLELPACYRFHHWCMAERERFSRARRAVLQALIARLAGDPPRALRHGRALVAADPLAEEAHASLVRLLAADARYPEAEAHYGWARALLRREVALADGGALDQAIRAVRQLQRHAAASPARSEAVQAEPARDEPMRAERGAPASERRTFLDLARRAVPAPPALVGRDAECRAIDAALAAAGPAPVLLLIGEPGIGKTRLLDHTSEVAARGRRHVIRARCFEAEAVRPYGFWLDALRALPTGGASAPVLDRAAPLLGGSPTALSREQLFDAAVDLLAALAQTRPLAVVVDDLQWIDDASAALLHFVARRLTAPPVLFVAAARIGEVDDNAAAKGLLQSLARERSLQRLELAPLAEGAVRGWLGDRLPDVGEAMRASGGNPLLLIEMARAGGGTQSGERSLDALVDERLHAFDAAARDLLGWAAALGGEFGADRLAAATAMPMPEVLSRIAQFERRGLLKDSGAGGFDFAHGLVRQAVYRGLSTARRRALHRQIARAFDVASAGDPWLHGAVVHHACLAGDAPLAARAALAAGHHWLRMFANLEAAQVAERGLALIDELAPGAERARLEIGLLRLRVAAAAAPGGRQLPDLSPRIERAIDTAQALALHAEASAAWEILAYWRQQAGDPAGARDASLAAEACTQLADAVIRCAQMANTGRCLLDIEADHEHGRALLAEAATLAAQLQLPVMELEWGRGLAARADGDLTAAREALARAVALARAAANHWREYECVLALATVEYEMGRTDEVLRHVDDVAAAARRMGEAQVPFADALAALARLRRGDADAAAAVEASLAALRECDDKAHLAYSLNESATCALAAGDGAEAARRAREALAAATAVRRPTQMAHARSIIAAAEGAAAPNPSAGSVRSTPRRSA
ncbi:MAG: AAA family ATPase [Burkholderiaceae bacterium]|nr:AAA family ATPase [Ideonella sp.]MCC7286079.1 AAA family ATPase [Burkholderiaceae bacterium]